jgi:hypothetical protein
MRTVLIPHMGVSDQLNMQGLVRHYASITPGTLVLTEQGNCKEMVEALYCDLPNLEVYSDAGIYPSHIFDDEYIKQVTRCSEIIRIGYNLIDWKDYPNMSFIDAFYLSKQVPKEYRYTNFRIPASIKEESQQVYDDFVKQYGNDYILIHEDPGHKKIGKCTYSINRGEFYPLIRNHMKLNFPVINLDQISKKVIDYYDVLKNAKEIHCIDSIWANFTYILTLSDPAFQTKKIYLHEYARTNKNPLLYRSPTPSNWVYLTD